MGFEVKCLEINADNFLTLGLPLSPSPEAGEHASSMTPANIPAGSQALRHNARG